MRINFGSDEELQIVFDPARAAELGIQIPRIAQVAGSADDVSGGFVDIGRRQYTVRFAGRYAVDQFADLVIEWRDGRPVRLGDVATVQVRRGDRNDLALQNGNPAIGIQIMKENDANVLETLTAVKAEIESMRDNELKKMGLSIAQSFDPSVFIDQAIDMVTGNLFAGILLAVRGALVFRARPARHAARRPVDPDLPHRDAGDAVRVRAHAERDLAGGPRLRRRPVARHRHRHARGHRAAARARASAVSKPRSRARSRCGRRCSPRTVTAVIVFLPIVFMRDAVSQLFADLALTISIAVIASLIVAVTALPLAASRWLNTENVHQGSNDRYAAIATLDRALDGRAASAATPRSPCCSSRPWCSPGRCCRRSTTCRP